MTHSVTSILKAIISVVLFLHSGQAKLKEAFPKDYYNGAVVEYEPPDPIGFSPAEILQVNLNNYRKLIRDASAQGADIIVFPEYGLTTLFKSTWSRDDVLPFLQIIPEVGINPCLQKTESYIIQDLSCAARNSGIYVVVNLGEIQYCSTTEDENHLCHGDGRRQYSVNIAFDRNGTIVAKYHKKHLYREGKFYDTPGKAELSTFKTDFGVEFGLFICFDLAHYDPPVQLVDKGIKNFAYPTAWVDILPFLTAIQFQSFWAASANVNLLASGYHSPIRAKLGSGIYSGKNGALNYTYDPSSGTRLIVARIPIVPKTLNQSTTTTFMSKPGSSHISHTIFSQPLQNFSSVFLDFVKFKDPRTVRICHNRICCTGSYLFSSDLNPNSELNYRLVAFDGQMKPGDESGGVGIQVCAILSCMNRAIESCVNKWEHENESQSHLPNFSHLKLTAGPFNMSDGHPKPALNAIDIYFNLIPSELFNIRTDGNSTTLFSNSLSQVDIKTLSIVNRVYEDDSPTI